jgi:hypothetical protein
MVVSCCDAVVRYCARSKSADIQKVRTALQAALEGSTVAICAGCGDLSARHPQPSLRRAKRPRPAP